MGSCLSTPGGVEISEVDKARHRQAEKQLKEVIYLLPTRYTLHDVCAAQAKSKLANQVKVQSTLALCGDEQSTLTRVRSCF